MSIANYYSEYNTFARIVNEYWGPQVSQLLFPDVEELLLKNIPEKAHILDLCCGAGHLAKKFLQKSYQVTGLDSSVELLRYAHENAPDGKFILDDARYFQLPSTFHGVVSTDYSLNHVTNLEDLICVFKNSYTALLPKGLFMFDLRLDEYYRGSWNNSMEGDVKEDYAWALKRHYNSEEKIGTINITTFQLFNNNWQRLDNAWLVKGYLREEVIFALKKVGFTEVNYYNIKCDLIEPEQTGAVYFVCRK